VLSRIAELHAMAFAEADVPVLPEEIITWSVGFVGEETVGAELARLGPSWSVLHAVPVGDRGSDIDHVVIGPAGVFCINTKHHRGLNVDVKQDAVFVGGQFCRYIDAIRLEGERTASVVASVAPGVPVHPLLVTVGAKLRVKETPAVVTFLPHDQLVAWLMIQPQRVDAALVAQLSEALSRSVNWSPIVPPPAAPEWVAELARSLATERALVSDQRRRGLVRGSARRASSATRPATAAGRERSRSAPIRSRKTAASRPPLIVRLLGFAAAMAAVVALLPVVVGAITSSIVNSVKVPDPRVSASAPVFAVVGAACATKGTVRTDSAGRALVCTPTSKAASATLVWRKRV
jgi:hypothetical protein